VATLMPAADSCPSSSDVSESGAISDGAAEDSLAETHALLTDAADALWPMMLSIFS